MREGLLPTIFGTAAIAASSMLRGADMQKNGMRKKDMLPLAGAALLGFGLAHVMLGTKDLTK